LDRWRLSSRGSKARSYILLPGRELTDDNGITGSSNGNSAATAMLPRILKSLGAHFKSQQGACRKEGHMLSYSGTVEATHSSATRTAECQARTTEYDVVYSFQVGISSRGKRENCHTASPRWPEIYLGTPYPHPNVSVLRKLEASRQAPISGPSPVLATHRSPRRTLPSPSLNPEGGGGIR
jgi:hypothetical protein